MTDIDLLARPWRPGHAVPDHLRELVACEYVPPGPKVRVLADSVSRLGHRLPTLEVTIALPVWQELLTYRGMSRGSGSSRAVPVEERIKQACENPFKPDRYPRKQRGMQPAGYIEPGTTEHDAAEREWLIGRDRAVEQARALLTLGVHKEIANRVLSPYLWNVGIVSASDLSNFFIQRLAPDAQRQIRQVAILALRALDASTPRELGDDEWHLPLTGYAGDEVLELDELIKVCIGRVARVSYLTHDGVRDVAADLDLYGRILEPGHMGPFEHAAHPDVAKSGNFTGFRQARWYVERGLEIPAAPSTMRAEVHAARVRELRAEIAAIEAAA